jgi:hypothetical protein
MSILLEIPVKITELLAAVRNAGGQLNHGGSFV